MSLRRERPWPNIAVTVALRGLIKRDSAEKVLEKIQVERTEMLAAPIIKIQTKDYLSVYETAKLLGLSRWTLTRAIQDNRLKAVRFGKRIVIKRADVDSLFV